MATYLLECLHPRPKVASITSLTKNTYTQCHALNLAFFVPKIHALGVSIGMKNRNRISKYGRVKERIKDLFGGNKFNRVSAISNTRPPVKPAGGLAKNTYGGLPMANTSQAPTIGQFAFNINLPANSFIKRFSAVRFLDSWQIVIDTESGQIATLKDPSTKRAMKFPTLDHLADWLGSQGVPEMNVFLPAGNDSTMRGAE